MSSSGFQKALHRYCTTIKACSHESDYSVLYDYVDMEQLLCHSCWNDENPARIDNDTVKIFRPNQMHAIRIRCLRCDADVTAQGGCTMCFVAC